MAGREGPHRLVSRHVYAEATRLSIRDEKSHVAIIPPCARHDGIDGSMSTVVLLLDDDRIEDVIAWSKWRQ